MKIDGKEYRVIGSRHDLACAIERLRLCESVDDVNRVIAAYLQEVPPKPAKTPRPCRQCQEMCLSKTAFCSDACMKAYEEWELGHAEEIWRRVEAKEYKTHIAKDLGITTARLNRILYREFRRKHRAGVVTWRDRP